MEFSLPEQILAAAFMLVTIGYFIFAMYIRLKTALSAQHDGEHEGAGGAAVRFVKEVIFQTKVIRDRPISGLLHAFVFWGFISYIPATIHHFLLPFTGGHGYLHGGLAEAYKLFLAAMSVLVAVSIAGLAFRRFVLKPWYFPKKLSGTSAIVSLFIFVLMITYLFEPYLAGMGALWKANWWIHGSCVLLFLVVIPHSKHLHLVFGPIDLLMKRKKFGQIPPFVIDLENFDEDMAFGIGTPADASREIRFDAFSCVECGRCSEMCPAHRIEKALDPRSLIHNLEKPLLTGNTDSLFEEAVSSEAVWQCVTCGACEHFCPVGVEHLPLVLQYRRNLTLEQTIIPEGMVNTFKALQTKGNVWLVDRELRAEKIEEMGLPLYEEGKMLIWSSCFFLTAEFVPHVKRFSDLLAGAGIDAGFSPEEICCGDPARKCGSEDLFQEIAAQNLEWMKNNGVKTIVSQCPHCLHTISDGYSRLDEDFNVEVIHYSELLARLLSEGKLETAAPSAGAVTVHDPCYSSRWQVGDVRAVRRLVAGNGVTPVEMKMSLERSYCCGSGGGAHHFFEDEDRIRIDDERIGQVHETGAKAVYTSCPFCFNMISEGLKRDETDIEVKDITQLLKT